jgi:hypothetical protein
MDARVFFEHVVKPNYHEALNSSRDFRAIWNAFHSVNTAIEAVALERVQYAQGRNIVDEERQRILAEHESLSDHKLCTEALKHVRKQTRSVTATSTNILPSDPSTWQIDINGKQRDLLTVLDRAFETISNFPELNPPSSS